MNFPTVENYCENSGNNTLVTIGDLDRSEEHTSELQSQDDIVCRLLLEKNGGDGAGGGGGA